MRKYPLHYLNDQEFANLVILICNKILGSATISFTEGKDGGKDGRFTGRTNCFPSKTQPWDGKVIIQVKHTSKENASCSDSDFQTILNKEIVSVQKLKANKELDYYLLFTNRKLTGGKDSKINELFNNRNIAYEIIANEKIQLFLQEYPDVVRTANLKDLLKPLEFDESDLKEIILALSPALEHKIDARIDFKTMDLEKKNELNNLSKSYFDDVIQRDIENFQKIDNFFSSPINTHLKDLYQDLISEINAKVVLNRNDYIEFESLLEELYNYVITNNKGSLEGKKRLVRTLLNYMYCQCDIGKKE
jgi:hypothetical protein